MRILFVADDYPWPERTGYRMRLAQLVKALAELGTVDLFIVVYDPRPAPLSVPPELPVPRSVTVDCRQAPGSWARRGMRWVRSGQPRGLLWGDWQPARTLLGQWASGRYDLVWFSHAPVHAALHDLVDGPSIVDLDNLDSFVLRQQRAARGRWTLRQLVDLVDERRWRRVPRRIARTAEVVTVCSELDRSRLDVANAVVIPNGYEPAGPSASDEARARPDGAGPVLSMVGLLSYAPNLDAAGYFVAHVLPRLRGIYPSVELRLVGRYRYDDDVRALREQPGVTVVGEVADIGPELAKADLAVVPIRSGGGTRIKILEAFAHRIPVVSTTVGCEGLDVVSGQHLLVSDTAADFAAACDRLLGDPELRDRLVAAAHELYLSHYQWATIRPRVTALARRTANS